MEIVVERLTVPQEDIDSYDHANCRKYLKYYQIGQEALLNRFLGVGYKGLETGYKVRALIRHSTIEYFHELFAGDEITINTTVGDVGNTSMTYRQSIERNSVTISEAAFTSVFTDLNRKPISIPDEIREKLVVGNHGRA
ncbi:MAG: acyl-CoA thioesterase [Candidatus Aenigmarchaeota archaeon]|nr:acyl-CoA thioesterase [Candidatus Aenigmarchaeota archaeon]